MPVPVFVHSVGDALHEVTPSIRKPPRSSALLSPSWIAVVFVSGTARLLVGT